MASEKMKKSTPPIDIDDTQSKKNSRDIVDNNPHDCMLSTIDNPFDPYDEKQYADWKRYDEEHGYYSESLLARVCKSSEAISDEDNAAAIEEAIDSIVSLNITGKFIKLLPPNKRH